MNRIGVAIVGVNGAVASTVIAGVELMKRGLVPRIGMVTEKDGRTDRRVDYRSARVRPARSPGLRRVGPAVCRTCTRARCTTRCSPARARPGEAGARAHQALAGRLLVDVRREARRQERRSLQRLPRGDRHPRAEPRGLQEGEQPRPRGHGQPRLDGDVPRGAAGSQEPARLRGRARRQRPGHLAGHALLLRRQQAAHPVLQLHAEPHQRAGAERPRPRRWATPSPAWTARRGRRC